MDGFSLGSVAQWVVILGSLVGVYINLRLRIEQVASESLRREELSGFLKQLEDRMDDKFQSLKELIDAKLESINHH